MEDNRVWEFEQSLWTGDAEHYEESIDESAVMVVPTPPYVLESAAAVKAVQDTPRWDSVEFADGTIVRPQEGLIAIGYTATAMRGDDRYVAHCTSTYRRIAHDEWKVVQHSQLPELAVKAEVQADS